MEFEVDGITVKIINPEAIPIAQKRIAELIIEMTEKKIAERDKNEIRQRECKSNCKNKRNE